MIQSYRNLIERAKLGQCTIYDFELLFDLHNALFFKDIVANSTKEQEIYQFLIDLFIKDTENFIQKILDKRA